MRYKRSRMQPANRTDALADVGNAAYTVREEVESLTLFGILCYEYDLVNDLFKGVDEPFYEGPSFIHEEVLLPPVCTLGFPTYENYR
jgi:hypothetical protein